MSKPVFTYNRMQPVRLSEGMKQASVHAHGKERIIAPLAATWDSFFLGAPCAGDDFLPERATQPLLGREAL